MEDFFEEEQRGDKADDLRDGEGEPDIIQHTGEGEQVRHWDEHDELTAQRDQHAVHAFTQGLEHAAGNDADSGQRVGEGGDAEGRMPMAIMASEASNRRSSGTGRKKNAAHPSSMMVTAVMVEVRMA